MCVYVECLYTRLQARLAMCIASANDKLAKANLQRLLYVLRWSFRQVGLQQARLLECFLAKVVSVLSQFAFSPSEAGEWFRPLGWCGRCVVCMFRPVWTVRGLYWSLDEDRKYGVDQRNKHG